MQSLFLWISLLAMVLSPCLALAGEFPQEFYLSSRGDAHVLGAEVVSKHALNFFTVSIWGQRWAVVTDYTTVVYSAAGEKIDLGEIQTGHFLEIKGKPVKDKVGILDASLIRDLSIKKGDSAVASVSILSSICPLSVSTMPPPSPSPAAVSPLISFPDSTPFTKDLKLGMKGEEVRLLQEFLQKQGWGIPNNGPVTGYFGKVTADALKKFQKASGLAAVGFADNQTRARINSLLKK